MAETSLKKIHIAKLPKLELVGSHFLYISSVKEAVFTELRSSFRPEFLNRIDETIIFDRLNKEELGSIIGLQLDRVCERLAKQGLGLDLSVKVRDYIALQGYDPTYGARPLKRAIQRYLLDPLSLDVLDGKFVDGDTIYAELDDSQGVVFSKL